MEETEYIYQGRIVEKTREEIGKDRIRLEKNVNRIVITLEDNQEIEIMPATLRDFMPFVDEKEAIKDLFMMIHEIEKERLLNEAYYLAEIRRLENGLSDARKELTKTGLKMVDIKRIQTLIKSFVDSKNLLQEYRRIVNILEKQKLPLRARLAELGESLRGYE